MAWQICSLILTIILMFAFFILSLMLLGVANQLNDLARTTNQKLIQTVKINKDIAANLNKLNHHYRGILLLIFLVIFSFVFSFKQSFLTLSLAGYTLIVVMFLLRRRLITTLLFKLGNNYPQLSSSLQKQIKLIQTALVVGSIGFITIIFAYLLLM